MYKQRKIKITFTATTSTTTAMVIFFIISCNSLEIILIYTFQCVINAKKITRSHASNWFDGGIEVKNRVCTSIFFSLIFNIIYFFINIHFTIITEKENRSKHVLILITKKMFIKTKRRKTKN